MLTSEPSNNEFRKDVAPDDVACMRSLHEKGAEGSLFTHFFLAIFSFSFSRSTLKIDNRGASMQRLSHLATTRGRAAATIWEKATSMHSADSRRYGFGSHVSDNDPEVSACQHGWLRPQARTPASVDGVNRCLGSPQILERAKERHLKGALNSNLLCAAGLRSARRLYNAGRWDDCRRPTAPRLGAPPAHKRTRASPDRRPDALPHF
jgi:hypothetical protein